MSKSEWERLRRTEVGAGGLSETSLWYEAAYEWSIVTMATVVRSHLSATHHQTPLFVVQAADQFVSCLDTGHTRDEEQLRAAYAKISQEVLQHPSMNDTGRLPSFCMFHIGMRVRFTQTVEKGSITVDQTATVIGLDFHANEPLTHKDAIQNPKAPVVLLRYFPQCVYVKLDRFDSESEPLRFLDDEPCELHANHGIQDSCKECRNFADVVAIEPFTSRCAWSIDIKALDVTVKVKRTQLPFVCAAASTEHVLQGSTCDPGLVFHWHFPRRLTPEMRWLSIYVALSRVRSLDGFMSVGLTDRMREDIEAGPPAGVMQRFDTYFGQKIKDTYGKADAAYIELGWDQIRPRAA